MKAIVYTQYGSPDVLHFKEINKPTPKENEVLIKVHATTVNRTDCANLTARPFIMRFSLGMQKPKIQVLGTEFAGEIVEIGKEVSSFKVGDRVFGFDDSILSSYAQYMTLPEDKGFAHIPEGTNYEQAAASTEGAHYAYNFINKVEIKKGTKVLVNGASGAIGSAAVQLLKYYNAEITAVTNSKNIELVKSLGASKVFDYIKEDFTKSDEKYDFVFDTVGKSSFGKCKHLLNSGGAYISSELGWMVQNLFFSLITYFFGKMPGQSCKKVLFPYPSDIKRSVLLIQELTAKGKFKSVIDRTYPLKDISEAYLYVPKGQKTGNVVITMDHSD